MASEEDSSDDLRPPCGPPSNTSKMRNSSRTRRVRTNGENETSRVDRLCTLHGQAQQTIDRQLRWTRAIDTKAMRLLRFNVVIIGLLLTSFSLVARFGIETGNSTNAVEGASVLVNLHTLVGGGALLFSMVVAGLTYSASKLKLGLGEGVLVQTQFQDYTDPEYHEKLVGGYYPQWIHDNMEKLRWNANLITATIWLVIYGVVLLVLGILHPLFSPVPEFASFLFTTLVVSTAAGISATDNF